MTSLLRILGVVSALVASGSSLSCTRCISPSDSCSGPNVTCSSGSVCGAVYTESWSKGTIDSKSYMMSCMRLDKCNIGGSFSMLDNARVKLGRSCCGTDLCVPPLPSLPGNSPRSNGFKCQSCTSADSTWCDSSDTMECMEEENMCFLQTKIVSGSAIESTAIRGCATKSICDFGSQSGSSQGVKTVVDFTCTNGSSGLQKSVYLPAVICIFFFKVFFWNV
ncbi:phospholipase A2 inhibitor and Ly6/PLAUR domain-containing protein-like [Rana temporaria]|uniref:phospholipase A2 inhibitor and Ly6/PLAUR domain-containing protein-like n=1 Tax=Rana temporaria TaxID=8407 RepID=UPI001AAD7C66|nr:phospholipase A2 inhibitor and Ly6/PLAUR domain-containing protein-like [Rana temporaria]